MREPIRERLGRALRAMLAVLACIGLADPALAAPPAVVASIAPIHSLVAGVMQGVAEPALLVSAGQSPHTYSLRPSNARALQHATLVVWIGPGLEAFLSRPLATLGANARVLELGRIDGLVRLPAREGGVQDEHGDVPSAGEHPGDHAHGGIDMHLWLDPRNATVFVGAIERALAAIDPAHEATYRRNAQAMRASIAQVDARTAARLAPLHDARYVVFHDAYQYFEHRYGLRAAGSITISPEVMPGAGRIREIGDAIRRSGAACVFAEPQFEPKLVRALVADTGVRAGVLDPIGAALPPGPGQYAALIDAMAGDFASCLAPADQPRPKASATR